MSKGLHHDLHRHLKRHIEDAIDHAHEAMKAEMKRGNIGGAFEHVARRYRLLEQADDLNRTHENEIRKRGK